MPTWIESWRQDIVYTFRALLRTPGFTIALVVTLALGIGANAAIFSFLDQVLLRQPSGVASPERVRRLWTQYPIPISKAPYVRQSLAHHEYRAIVPVLRDDVELALYTTRTHVPIGRDDGSSTATVAYATASYFTVLGVRLAAGRAFTDAEADVRGAKHVVVVSNAFWRRHLGVAGDVLGKSITIDGTDFTIIGVTAPRFTGVDLQESELWLPLGVFPTHDVPRVPFWDSSVILFSAIGRIAPGVNEKLAEERASNRYRHAPLTDFPVSESARVFFRSIIEARGLGSTTREIAIGLRLAVVAFIVLLLAVANVVNLLLARAVARQREVAVRLALGISRQRLIRFFVTESVLLSLAAGTAALLLTQVTGNLLRSLLLPGIEFGRGSLGPLVVAVTFGLSLATGLVAGFITALHAGGPDLTHSLKSGARGGDISNSTLSKVLVGAQAAFSVMLLVGASLVVRSLLNVQRARIGFDTDHLAFASVTLPYGERPDSSGFVATMRGVSERLTAVPGVEAVAFTRDEPMTGFPRVRFYTATDSSEGADRLLPTGTYVSGEFFSAMGIAFTRGATFSDESESAATAVVVNRALARAYWPDRDPVGQCIYIQARSTPCLTIVGVVEDAIRQGLLEEPAPQLYLPIFRSIRGRRPPRVMVIRADPRKLGSAMAHAASLLRGGFPRGVPTVSRMSDRLAPQYRPWRLGAAMFSAFGALALVVAALGIYSSVAYAVSQRTHEIGVRIALGASLLNVVGDVVARGIRPVVGGGFVGALLALPGARLVSALLYNTESRDPVMLVAVMVTLIVVGATAAVIPGLRAARIDPVRAMAAD